MEFSIKSGSPERARADCIVVGVFEPRKLTRAGDTLDRATNGHVGAILKRGDMEGKAGATLMLHDVPNVAAGRVLLVGLGREGEFDERKYLTAVGKVVAALTETGVREAVLCMSAILNNRDVAWGRNLLAESARSSSRLLLRCPLLPNRLVLCCQCCGSLLIQLLHSLCPILHGLGL